MYYDIHELQQVVNEFVPVFKNDLIMEYSDEIKNDIYEFKAVINGKSYVYSHNVDKENLKAKIKFFSKNDVYDSLSNYTGISIPWGSHTGVRPVALAGKLLRQIGEENTVEALVNDYRMSKEKARLCTDIALTQQPLLNNNKKSIDVYISIPFCASRCTYCSFSLIGIEKKRHLHSTYTKALCSEIEAVGKAVLDMGYVPRCLYMGGGTPTAIRPELLDMIMKSAAKVFSDFKEFTLEAGRADTIDTDMLKVINKYNVTRFNINPQTMNDDILKGIGRNHSSEDVFTAYELVRSNGHFNINMDVIAGLPGETIESFKNTIEKVLKMDPEAITVHTFALKRASSLKKQDYGIKGNSVADKMLEYAYKRLGEMDYNPYYLYRQKNMEDNGENVGFCKKGYECVYNIDIMEENTHILAFGSGAVSKRIKNGGLIRRSDPKDIEVYIDRIKDTVNKSIEFFSEN